MNSFVTDTQALVKFMMGKKVINDKAHQAFLAADKGEAVIIIPAIVLMEVLYLFEKHRIGIGLLHTDDLLKCRNYQFEPLSLEILRHGSKSSNTGFVIPACFWRESSPAQPLDSRQKHAGMTVGGADCYPKQGVSEPCRFLEQRQRLTTFPSCMIV